MREIMLTHSKQPVHRSEPFLAYFTNAPLDFAFPHPVRFATAGEARTASIAFAHHNLGWQAGSYSVADRI